ncbi:DUF4245 domain-containing protein [Leucobacter sp. cx-328]|uniref:DUF4245 family protein n=1 Tax=unclassified Leucobacter TaxID=2621730 RepID=UPI00165DFC92|nr:MULTISPECIES: DUF4245 family protein [unclassified Leucobacter]MBC9943082.1 DUF4245 domain-containing protein [Leucobacter sp. cx-328]
MAKKSKAPVVVAELGRPETAYETAARKAENSRLYKSRKTLNNLVFSLLVSFGLMLVIYFMMPQSTGDFDQRSVDVAAIAEQSGPGLNDNLAVPAVDAGWKAKSASLKREDGFYVWRIHYTTADEAYASVTQIFTETGEPVLDVPGVETYLNTEVLEALAPTGQEALAGTDWTLYDYPNRGIDKSNIRFALSGAVGNDAVIVSGTDTAGTIRVLATQVMDSLAEPADQATGGSAETQ